MKPRELQNEAQVLEPRLEAHQRARYREDLIEKKGGLIETAWDAITEIDGMYGLGEGTINETGVVVLEYRDHDELGRYAIVGKLRIEGEDQRGTVGDEDRGRRKLRVHVGAAFDKPSPVASESEEELGEGIDGRKWYGEWFEHESTSGVEDMLQRLADWGNRANKRQGADNVHSMALRDIDEMKESIGIILASARDEELNPKPVKTEPHAASA